MAVDEYTKLLLHFDGADESTDFVDASGKHTVSILRGSPQIDTSASNFGGASLYLPTGLACIKVSTPDEDFDYRTGDFTIDFWMKTSTAGYRRIATGYNDAWGYSWQIGLSYNYNNTLWVRVNASSFELQGNITITDGEWHHVAVVREGDILYLFVDGIIDDYDSLPELFDWTFPFYPSLTIGNHTTDEGYGFAGNIDEFRVSKGIARWTDNFTPPTRAYGIDPGPGADANTLLLMHMSDDNFTDTADRHLITAENGAATSEIEYRFAPAALALAGDGDYLSTPASADWSRSTDPVTIEMQLYLPSAASLATEGLLGCYVQNLGGIDYGEGWGLRFRNAGGYSRRLELAIYHPDDDPTLYYLDCEFPTDEWVHVALARESGALRWFLRGIKINTQSFLEEMEAATLGGGLSIGINCIPAYPEYVSESQECFIDELRISDVARWTDDFTPPARAYGSWNIAGASGQADTAGLRLSGAEALADLVARYRIAGIEAQADILLLAELAAVSSLDAAWRIAGESRAGVDAQASILRDEVLRAGGAGGWLFSIAAMSRAGGGGWADITRPQLFGQEGEFDLAFSRRAGADNLAEQRVAYRAGAETQTEVWTRDAYAVYLDDEYLGDIPAEPDAEAGETNTLALGALADGTYTVTICPRGRFWRETGAGKILTVVVANGSAAAATLPAVTGLGLTYESGLIAIGWTLPAAFGAEYVTGFGLWYAPAGQTPNLEAAPDDILPAWEGVRARYQAFREPGGAEVAAICCLDRAGRPGPAAMVELPLLTAAPISPPNQTADSP